jgi:hypothetical protein
VRSNDAPLSSLPFTWLMPVTTPLPPSTRTSRSESSADSRVPFFEDAISSDLVLSAPVRLLMPLKTSA